ncbi:hypothetical protein PI124_g20312 [Phytophthora idaei]|nr:hypothetical protein PI125_g13603 [Phytophthora idaei]KAG3147819.1 hypothetical protein PI126_g12722 [Phytophthora idaei]KAG3234636.1 hypothetical protein PI124_g20312 [Phytophthora idaei]
MDTTNERLDTHRCAQSTRDAGQSVADKRTIDIGLVPAPFLCGILAPSWSTGGRGYVRVDSAKYRDWQVLAYETALDRICCRKSSDCTMSGCHVNHQLWKGNSILFRLRSPTDLRAEPELTCAERWAKVDAAAEANTPTVNSEAGIDTTHTGVIESGSTVLNSAVEPCDVEDESTSAFLYARGAGCHEVKFEGDRVHLVSKTNSSGGDTTARFDVWKASTKPPVVPICSQSPGR